MFMMFTMVMFMYMVFSIIMFMYTTVCSLKDALSHLVHDLDVLQYHVHDALSHDVLNYIHEHFVFHHPVQVLLSLAIIT